MNAEPLGATRVMSLIAGGLALRTPAHRIGAHRDNPLLEGAYLCYFAHRRRDFPRP